MSKQALKRVRRALKMEVNRKPLDAYSWPGGYPMYYLAADGEALCPDCVNADIELVDFAKRDADQQWHVIGVDVNWEDTALRCAHCNKTIESAYDPDETAVIAPTMAEMEDE